MEKKVVDIYNFERVQVISAGERDPDADDVSGMSASKMRKAVSDDDFTSFSQGMPKAISNSDTKSIYNAVRKGMGLKEQNEFKKHVQLDPISEIRENYVQGNLFAPGDTVIIKETGELVKVKYLGSNYVIVESHGTQYRKWIDSIEKIEEREDPEIGGRKGSQPAQYHAGLSKKTKLARDRQFKRQTKMDDDNPAAYKPAPGDAKSKTKPSKHTKRFKQMFGDDVDEVTVSLTRQRISREKEVERRRDAADAKRHDAMLDRARLRSTRMKNRGTNA